MKRVNSISALHLAAVAVLLLSVGIGSASAQYNYAFRDSLGSYRVQFTPHERNAKIATPRKKPLNARTFEVRLGIAYAAHTAYGISSLDGSLPYNHYYDYENNKQHDYSGAVNISGERWATLNGDFGYWIKDWLYVGGTLTWTGGFEHTYRISDSKRAKTQSYNQLTIMPTVRLAWLRRGIVQLYSGAGLGVGVALHNTFNSEPYAKPAIAYDITFLGIAVGRDWFGYADFGIGTRGIVSVGFGHRFTGRSH